jgi:Ca2+-binding EF-hand superfamily protein
MRETFAKFDTSGDGYLDAEELRLAIKVAKGDEVPLEDCKELIAEIDCDGDGVIDFRVGVSAL